MSHGVFNQSTCYVSGPGNNAVVLLSMEDLTSSRISSKYLHLCSEDERVWNDMRVSMTEFSILGELTL